MALLGQLLSMVLLVVTDGSGKCRKTSISTGRSVMSLSEMKRVSKTSEPNYCGDNMVISPEFNSLLVEYKFHQFHERLHKMSGLASGTMNEIASYQDEDKQMVKVALTHVSTSICYNDGSRLIKQGDYMIVKDASHAAVVYTFDLLSEFEQRWNLSDEDSVRGVIDNVQVMLQKYM